MANTWFGLVKPDEINLVWSDGTLVSSQMWHDMPDIKIQANNHPCFHLALHSDQWHDNSCDGEYPFVCEGQQGRIFDILHFNVMKKKIITTRTLNVLS